ncbi:MAG TPA: hypothetical protein VKD69_27110 [Vicinamibacterales bacterium]|nr:hypothetical protein [Vicinamibacterales bacterium]
MIDAKSAKLAKTPTSAKTAKTGNKFFFAAFTFFAAFAFFPAFASQAAAGDRYALIVSGAAGGDQYAAKYTGWRTAITSILLEQFKYPPDRIVVLADADEGGVRKSTRENVRQAFGDFRKRMTKDDQLLVLLIGHGTTGDGDEAKFNLVGPDLSAGEWAELMRPIPGRLVFVNTTAASFPFLRKIAGRGRVVLTATDSSAQQFETVFADYFVKAFGVDGADVDKSGRVSMWEAFSFASAGVRSYFEQKGQLPTERPLLDDTGAGIGREASQTQGTDGALARVTYLQPEPPLVLPADAAQAALVRRRAELEAQLEELKARKENMSPEQYDLELEKVLIEIARVGAQLRTKS